MYASVKLTNISSDNGLSPIRRQAIIWTNAVIVSIRPQGTYFSEILLKIPKFSFKKIHLKISCAKWRPQCVNILNLSQICLLMPACWQIHCFMCICFMCFTIPVYLSCIFIITLFLVFRCCYCSWNNWWCAFITDLLSCIQQWLWMAECCDEFFINFGKNVFVMMTWTNGNIFHITGPLWGEFTGHRWIPLTKASNAELWCLLLSAPEQTVEQTIEMPVIWDAITLIMMSL